MGSFANDAHFTQAPSVHVNANVMTLASRPASLTVMTSAADLTSSQQFPVNAYQPLTSCQPHMYCYTAATPVACDVTDVYPHVLAAHDVMGADHILAIQAPSVAEPVLYGKAGLLEAAPAQLTYAQGKILKINSQFEALFLSCN